MKAKRRQAEVTIKKSLMNIFRYFFFVRVHTEGGNCANERNSMLADIVNRNISRWRRVTLVMAEKNMAACFPKCDRAWRMLLLKYRNIATDISLPRTRRSILPEPHDIQIHSATQESLLHRQHVPLCISSSHQTADNKKKFPILKCPTDMWRVLLRAKTSEEQIIYRTAEWIQQIQPFRHWPTENRRTSLKQGSLCSLCAYIITQHPSPHDPLDPGTRTGENKGKSSSRFEGREPPWSGPVPRRSLFNKRTTVLLEQKGKRKARILKASWHSGETN